MLLINKQGIMDGLRCSKRTCGRRVSGLPDASWPRYHYNRYWHVAGVIGSLEPWERDHAPDLLDRSIDDSILHCGDHEGAICNANLFLRWAGENPATADRWNSVRTQFTQVLLNAPGCAAFAPFSESLTRRFCLVPGVTRFVVTGDKGSLGSFPALVPAFALVNSGFDSLTIVGDRDTWAD